MATHLSRNKDELFQQEHHIAQLQGSIRDAVKKNFGSDGYSFNSRNITIIEGNTKDIALAKKQNPVFLVV